MAGEKLSLQEIVGRSYARAIPANKLVKLIHHWLERCELGAKDAEDAIADALLQQLARPSPPALVLTYLSEVISTQLVSAQTFLIHLLFLLQDRNAPSIDFLTSICGILLANLTGLGAGTNLPPTFTRPAIPIPDIGTSAAAQQSVETAPVPTLSLFLPLLRQCTTSTSTPIFELTARLLALTPPYPAPPLDVGLEVGGLLQSLPEKVSTPLKNCLSGLMVDLAINQGAADLSISGALEPSIPNANGSGGAGQAVGELHGLAVSGNSSLPLSQALAFLLSYIHHANRLTPSRPEGWDSPTAQLPPSHHLVLHQLGPRLTPDPPMFLSELIASAIQAVGGSLDGRAERWQFLIEGLPALILYWRDHSDQAWPYPDSLGSALETAFASQNSPISDINTWQTQGYNDLVAIAEAEEESGGWSPPDEYSLTSLQACLIQRCVAIELINQEEGSRLAPSLPTSSNGYGESLMSRIASAHTSHLPPLAHIVAYAPGAAKLFADDVLNCIRASPLTPPPDGLFTNMSLSPTLLASMTATISSTALLNLLNSYLLDPPDNPALRSDDPQGCSTRFGEGVVLIEAVAHLFQLPVPNLLDDARRALALGDLDASQKSLMNRWVKALFGSDGIEDEILLATSPQQFCRLATGLIQQAIIATSAGQIDMDTLHSGLSYFSQPLLSWSLGGIVDWLCAEVIRNGLLAPFHLIVLQNLVLSASFPEPLLAINGEAIARLVAPSTGLGPVLQSSNFDVVAIMSKLQAAKISNVILVARPSSQVLNQLRADLQSVRLAELPPLGWTTSLLEPVDSCLISDGRSAVVDVLLSEVLRPMVFDLNTVNLDPLSTVVTIVLNLLPFDWKSPKLLHELILTYVPTLFDAPTSQQPQARQYLAMALARILKTTLLFAYDLDHASGQGYARMPREVLQDLNSRGVKPGDGEQIPKKARTEMKQSVHGLSVDAMEVLEMVLGVLRGDEELRAVFVAFSEL